MLEQIGAHIAAYADTVFLLGPSVAMPLLILALSWVFSAIHILEELRGANFPLWRAFGAIEGVYVPNWLGFLFFTVALWVILWSVGAAAIVGLGVWGPLTTQHGVF